MAWDGEKTLANDKLPPPSPGPYLPSLGSLAAGGLTPDSGRPRLPWNVVPTAFPNPVCLLRFCPNRTS